MPLKRSVIDKLISRGVNFIHDNQLPWGEIANYNFVDSAQTTRTYRCSVFPTALVLHSLSRLNHSERVETIKRKGVDFILRNRENGYWRYFGSGSEYPADLDTTACCLSVLSELGLMREDSVAEALLSNRDEATKLFYTWVGNSPIMENDFDSAVNANILWLYALLGKSDLIKEVVDWVVRESGDLHTQNSQRWY